MSRENVSAEVKLFALHDQFVIAFHSLSGLVETGLRICPPEKMARRFGYRSSAGHFLQSGFGAGIAKLRHFQAIFRGIQPGFSATQTVWRREWDSRRPFVTVLARSIRCRKPLSLPLVRLYHTRNTSHTRNVD